MGSAALGRYILDQEIAAGGMATVHIGRLLGHGGFARTVAIKRMHAHLAKDPVFVDMFLDEARLAARIRHPNVIAALDVASMAGEVFLVMDYVHGESLSRLCRAVNERGERVPVGIACAVMREVLAGLHAAHEATSDAGEPLGIVHRDVSPQNVLVGADGAARLLDFGVAKAASRYRETQQGELKGKLAYMAPEQVKMMPVDRRTDVFALSIVLWEILTGRRLFDAPEPAATIANIVAGEIARPGTLVPEVSSALDEVVLRGLERDPDRRFQTALEMERALYDAAPLPAPHAVADWVRATASAALEQRARWVAGAESRSTSDLAADGGALTVARGAPSEAPTDVSASLALEPPKITSAPEEDAATLLARPAPAPRRSRGLWLVGGLVVAAGGAAIATLSLRGSAQAPSIAASIEPPAPASTAPEVVASAAVTATSSAPPPEASSPPPPPKAAPRGRAADCKPNYFIDEHGIKRFKPNCLR